MIAKVVLAVCGAGWLVGTIAFYVTLANEVGALRSTVAALQRTIDEERNVTTMTYRTVKRKFDRQVNHVEAVSSVASTIRAGVSPGVATRLIADNLLTLATQHCVDVSLRGHELGYRIKAPKSEWPNSAECSSRK